MSFLNNGFMSALGKIADMFFLSVLWILFSLPVVTIVPSTIALYYATVKVVRRDAGYVFRDFLNGFRQNLKQGMALELIYFIIGALLYAARRFAYLAGLTSTLGRCYYLFFLISVIVISCVSAYLLPVISRFTLSLLSAFRLAVFFSLTNLLTLVPVLITLAAGIALAWVIPPAVLVLPSAWCFLHSYGVEKALVRYIKEQTQDPQQHEGRWYMEE